MLSSVVVPDCVQIVAPARSLTAVSVSARVDVAVSAPSVMVTVTVGTAPFQLATGVKV